MKVLNEMHAGLAARAARNAVPIECACGVQFAWTRGTVVCPSCGARDDDLVPAQPTSVAAQIAAAQSEAVK